MVEDEEIQDCPFPVDPVDLPACDIGRVPFFQTDGFPVDRDFRLSLAAEDDFRVIMPMRKVDGRKVTAEPDLAILVVATELVFGKHKTIITKKGPVSRGPFEGELEAFC